MVMDLLQGHQIYELPHILQEHDQIFYPSIFAIRNEQ